MSEDLASTHQEKQPVAELNFWEQQIDLLEDHTSLHAGTKMMPDSYIKAQGRILEIPACFDPASQNVLHEVTRYYELVGRDLAAKQTLYDVTQSAPFNKMIYALGPEVVGAAFAQEPEDGALHAALIDRLEDIDGTAMPADAELDTLKAAYSAHSLTQLLSIKGEGFADEVARIVRKPDVFSRIRFYEQAEQEDESHAEFQRVSLEWITSVVQTVSGLSAEEAREYSFSASRNASNEEILSLIEKFDALGADRLRAISAKTGIYGIEAYSVEQLERMERLLTVPAETAEHLSQHDVIVVMVNRVGDHNGVLRSISKDIEDDSGRVLFFEINRLSDIYRRMSFLHKQGIRPATLVLSAHSAPGQFQVTDGREPGVKKQDIATIAGVQLVNKMNATAEDQGGLPEEKRAYSIDGLQGFPRLVENYMMPSRSIEDGRADTGRKKIIFQACYAAQKDGVADIDFDGEKQVTGHESVISQLGKNLKQSGISSKVDVYGADREIQLGLTPDGLGYTISHPDGMGNERVSYPATRIRVTPDGLIADTVAGITLSKKAA